MAANVWQESAVYNGMPVSVRAGTDIIVVGKRVYFIGNDDMIYQCRETTTGNWQYFGDGLQ